MSQIFPDTYPVQSSELVQPGELRKQGPLYAGFVMERKMGFELIYKFSCENIIYELGFIYMDPSHEEPHRIFFETLSNKVRWDVVHLLRKGNCRSTDIAQQLGYEQSLVSHHLKRLEKCGFVSATTDGKERTYELNHKTIKLLLAIVEEHTNKFCKKLCSKCLT